MRPCSKSPKDCLTPCGVANPLADQLIQLPQIETGLAIVFPRQFQDSESVFVSSEASVLRLVQINQACRDYEEGHHRFRRVIGDNQGVRLAGRFVNKGSGLGNPIMFQVSPVTMHRISVNGANVIVSAQFCAREALEHDAEPSSRNVKLARLEPHAVSVRNPKAVVFQIDVGNEMFAAPLIGVESISETVEISDWHVFPCIELVIEPPGSSATLPLTVSTAIDLIEARRGRSISQGSIPIGRATSVRGRVICLILRQSPGMILTGVGVGVFGAVVAGELSERAVDGVRAMDPWTFAMMVAVLVAAALLASFVPARRASRVDPLVAVRRE
jgi:hypothetical protein